MPIHDQATAEAALRRLGRALESPYPAGVFPELTQEEWRRARQALADVGLSLDRVSASHMRHVGSVVAGSGSRLVDALLGADEPALPDPDGDDETYLVVFTREGRPHLSAKLSLLRALGFYEHVRESIAQGSAMLCRVLHDVDTRRAPETLLDSTAAAPVPDHVAHEIRRLLALLADTLDAPEDRDAVLMIRNWLAAARARPDARPEIVCLVGSTRFVDVAAVEAWTLAKQGVLALGLHLLPAWYEGPPDHLAEAEGVRDVLDELHLRKIDMADRVRVLNVDGYIGERTAFEIAYARERGKPVEYLEPLDPSTSETDRRHLNRHEA